MDYVIKFGHNYVGKDGKLTASQKAAGRIPGSLKPFVTPDAGYRFVRIRPAGQPVQETETEQN